MILRDLLAAVGVVRGERESARKDESIDEKERRLHEIEERTQEALRRRSDDVGLDYFRRD